jgi:acetyl-CoA carboxylase biotin carboxyl carrier protein
LDTKELRKLIEFISKSEFTEFEMEQEGFRLRLSRVAPAGATAGSRPPAPTPAPPGPVAVTPPAPAVPESAESAAAPGPENGLEDVRSPIVGTFYRSPGPQSPPFVAVGDQVEIGQILCIIEAMKLMNEIQAEVAGEIIEVLPTNAQPVEFDEILFRVRPVA